MPRNQLEEDAEGEGLAACVLSEKQPLKYSSTSLASSQNTSSASLNRQHSSSSQKAFSGAAAEFADAVDLLQYDKNKHTMDQETIHKLMLLALRVRGDTRLDLMREFPREKKMVIISQVMLIIAQTQTENEHSKTPRHYIDLITQCLKSPMTPISGTVEMVKRVFGSAKKVPILRDVIAELKVQCQCQPVSWLKEFIKYDGFIVLFRVLESINTKSSKSQKRIEIESDTLKILRFVANHHVSFLLI